MSPPIRRPGNRTGRPRRVLTTEQVRLLHGLLRRGWTNPEIMTHMHLGTRIVAEHRAQLEAGGHYSRTSLTNLAQKAAKRAEAEQLQATLAGINAISSMAERRAAQLRLAEQMRREA